MGRIISQAGGNENARSVDRQRYTQCNKLFTVLAAGCTYTWYLGYRIEACPYVAREQRKCAFYSEEMTENNLEPPFRTFASVATRIRL